MAAEDDEEQPTPTDGRCDDLDQNDADWDGDSSEGDAEIETGKESLKKLAVRDVEEEAAEALKKLPVITTGIKIKKEPRDDEDAKFDFSTQAGTMAWVQSQEEKKRRRPPPPGGPRKRAIPTPPPCAA